MTANEEKPEDPQRAQARYETYLQAWVGTQMEADRTILAFSSAGLGLLVTLLTTSSFPSNNPILAFTLVAAAACSFLVSIVAGILILRRNGVVLMAIVKRMNAGEDAPSVRDPCIAKLDRFLDIGAGVGAALALTLALIVAWQKPPRTGEQLVAEELKPVKKPLTEKSLGDASDLGSKPPKTPPPQPKPAPAPAPKKDAEKK